MAFDSFNDSRISMVRKFRAITEYFDVNSIILAYIELNKLKKGYYSNMIWCGVQNTSI